MVTETNCRLCFKKLDEDYSFIFGNQNKELSLGAKIMICLSIPVHDGDTLPQKICIPCTDEVTRFYDFRNKCHITYYSLIQECQENVELLDNKVELSSTKDDEISEEYVNNTFDTEETGKDSEIAEKIVEEEEDDFFTNNLAEEKNPVIVEFENKESESEIGEEQTFQKRFKCSYCTIELNSYHEATKHFIECLKAKQMTTGNDSSTDLHKNDKEIYSEYEHIGISDDEINCEDSVADVEFIEDMDCDDENKNDSNIEELVADQELKEQVENEQEENLVTRLHEEDCISSDEPCQDESENKDPDPKERPKRRYRKKKIYPDNYPCPECKKPFTSRSLMQRHFMVHTGERPHKCETCGRRFSQVGALNFHKKLHEDPPYRCNVCSKPLMRPSDLEKHLRTHTGEKPYTCHFCGKNFTQLVAVQQHERIHTGAKPYQCKICGKAFSQSANKSKHEKIHQKGAKPYVCDKCGRSFSDNEEMEVHKAGHGGGKARECDFCSMKFKKLSEVVDHVRRFHTFEKPHTCDFCKKAFYSLYSLKQHIMTHTGQKPFACTECPSKFTQKGNLVKHFGRKHPGKTLKDTRTNKDNYENNSTDEFKDNESSADKFDTEEEKIIN